MKRIILSLTILIVFSFLFSINVLNPGFENDFDNWTKIGTLSKITISTTTVHSESKSCLFQEPTSSYSGRGVSSNFVSVTVGQSYTVSVWFYVDQSIEQSVISDSKVRVKIYYYDSSYTEILSDSPNGSTLSSFNTWEQISRSKEAPENSAYAKVFIDVQEIVNDNDGIYVDDIVIDGDQPLPVTFKAFTAIVSEDQCVRLNWVTESESEMNGYIIYRSQSTFEHFEYSSSLIASNNSPQTHKYYFEDYEVRVGETYRYWVEALNLDGTSEFYGPVCVTIEKEEEEEVPELAEATLLHANYPNPFNPSTTISFEVKDGETAELTIYNGKGQKILSETFRAQVETHTFEWNAEAYGSGIYFYRLQSDSYNKINKMMMLK